VQLPKEQGPAHLFLARHNLKMGKYREAEAHAHKATEFITVSASLPPCLTQNSPPATESALFT